MSQTTNLFISYLQDKLDIVNSEMDRCFTCPSSTSQEELDKYLYSPLRDYSKNGGKRTRPVICLLGCEACGGDIQDALPLAIAIENFQSAALIHDDIADKGELRRGVPCMHLTQGTGLAINCGDLALASVCGDIIENNNIDNTIKPKLLSELTQMTIRTIEGQALDLGWVRDNRWDITPDNYLDMATHKTAYYSAATPLAIGAICAGAPTTTVEALRTFGMKCGLSFQIQDDILNLFGDEEGQGKDFRCDITEGKRTMLVVVALSRLDKATKQELIDILCSHTQDKIKLDRAAQIIKDCGALEQVQDFALNLTNDAKQAISNVDLDEHLKDVLLSMADFFVNRSK